MASNLSIESNISNNLNVSELWYLDLNFKIPKVTFLLVIAACGLVGNILLLLILLRGKKSVINILILNLCVVGLCECWLNMSIVLGALLSDGWIFGDPMCKFNAFCMSAVFIELVLTLLCVSIERFLTIRFCVDPKTYLTIRRILFVILYSWIHSILFSLPLLIGVVTTTYRAPLHLCSVSDSSSLIYIVLTSVICFIIPIITMVTMYLLIIHFAFKERKVVQSLITQNQYKEKKSQKLNIQTEIVLSKYGAVLFCLWFALGVPYIISAYIRQYLYSNEFQKNNIGSLVDYPWSLDVTFVYLRFFYSSLFPVLTFFMLNSYWTSLKDTLLCRRSNSISDVATSKKSQVVKKQPGKCITARGPTKSANSQSNRVFNVPVLFATSDGIHIETNDSENDSARSKSENDIIEVKERNKSELNTIPKGKTLDVGPRELEYSRHDTSDYDSSSEIDVYSSSQPVSMRQVMHDVQLTQRSVSQPEVWKENVSNLVTLKDVKKSCGTDSGLDLSVTENALNQSSIEKTLIKSGTKFTKSFNSVSPASLTELHQIVPSARPKSAQTRSIQNTILSNFPSPKQLNKSCNNQVNAQNVLNFVNLESQNLTCAQNSEIENDSELGLDVINVPETYLSVSQRVKLNSEVSRQFPRDTDDYAQIEFGKDGSDSAFSMTLPNEVSSSNACVLIQNGKSQNSPADKPPTGRHHKKSKFTKLKNFGETFNIPKKNAAHEIKDSGITESKHTETMMTSSKVKGHKRHDTSDSQKSLLGSGSSAELTSLKEACFPDTSSHDN